MFVYTMNSVYVHAKNKKVEVSNAVKVLVRVFLLLFRAVLRQK